MENSKLSSLPANLRPVRKGDTAWCRFKSGVHSFVVASVQGSIVSIERDGWRGEVHIKRAHLQWRDASEDAAPVGPDDDGPVIKPDEAPVAPVVQAVAPAGPLSPISAGLRTAIQALVDADPEMIDNARVDTIGEQCVELDVAFSPVVTGRCDDWQYNAPKPSRVTKGADGRYWVDDLQGYAHVESVKIMRARYLLMRGWFYKHLRTLPYSEQQRVLAWYFEGGVWIPPEGSALAKGMGVL